MQELPKKHRPTTRVTEETRYRLLKLLEAQFGLTQRQLADALGISVGKVNYCLRSLSDDGCVDVREFKNSHQKRALAYLLTSKGVEKRNELTKRFLTRKKTELEALKAEILRLEEEIDVMNGRKEACQR